MWNNLGTAYEQLDQLDDARAAFDKGGVLGSKEAMASRKRLEGVKTTVVIKDDKPEAKDAKTYETREPGPEESAKPEDKVDETKTDDTKPEVEKTESDAGVKPL